MYDEYISVYSQYIYIYTHYMVYYRLYNSIYMNISISDHFWDTNMMPIQLRSKHSLVEWATSKGHHLPSQRMQRVFDPLPSRYPDAPGTWMQQFSSFEVLWRLPHWKLMRHVGWTMGHPDLVRQPIAPSSGMTHRSPLESLQRRRIEVFHDLMPVMQCRASGANTMAKV